MKRCVHCLARKQKIVSFHSHPPSRKSELLELVHSDLCGPFKVKSKDGALYFSNFIDDRSRKIWVYSLKSKDQVLYVFKQFQALSKRQMGKKLKCIRTDNGGEYIGPFDNYCKSQEIHYQKSSDDKFLVICSSYQRDPYTHHHYQCEYILIYFYRLSL